MKSSLPPIKRGKSVAEVAAGLLLCAGVRGKERTMQTKIQSRLVGVALLIALAAGLAATTADAANETALMYEPETTPLGYARGDRIMRSQTSRASIWASGQLSDVKCVRDCQLARLKSNEQCGQDLSCFNRLLKVYERCLRKCR